MNYDYSYKHSFYNPVLHFDYNPKSAGVSHLYSSVQYENNIPKENTEEKEEKKQYLSKDFLVINALEEKFNQYKYEIQEEPRSDPGYFSVEQLKNDRQYLLLKNQEIEKEIEKINKLFAPTINLPKENKTLKKEKTKQILNTDSKNNSKILLTTTRSVNSKSTNKVRFDLNKHKERLNQEKPLTKNEENLLLRKEIRRLTKIRDELKNKPKSAYLQRDKLSQINSNDIKKEICLWRERTFELKDNYIKCIKEIKRDLFNDRTIIQEEIRKMQKEFENNIKDIQKKYLMQINKNEKNIEILKNENKELLRLQSKVKEVYYYNFDS